VSIDVYRACLADSCESAVRIRPNRARYRLAGNPLSGQWQWHRRRARRRFEEGLHRR